MNSVSKLFRIRCIVVVIFSSLLLTFVAGCDTIARIPFPQRSLEQVNSSGFISPAGSCTGTNGENGQMKLRFVLTDESDEPEPIWPGESLGEESVELTPQSLSFTNSSLYETANGVCESNSACSTSGFQCVAPPDNQGQPPKRCLASTNMSVSNLQFVSRDAPQFFGVVMENSGSLQGWIPNQRATSKSYDYCTETNGTCECENNDQPCTPDGETDSPPISSQVRSIATDVNLSRIAQLKRMETALSSVAEKARREDGRETYFGLWSFSNQNQPSTYLESSAGWTSNIGGQNTTQFDTAVRDLESSAGEVNRTRANIYEATQQVIDQFYTNSHLNQFTQQNSQAQPEKVLTLLVDGPDDLRESDATTIDDLISSATQNNVRVFVVHLDPTMANPRQLRDDPRYYRDQSTCSNDSSCKNFETCRKPRRYGPADSAVDEPSVPSPDARFCLPDRGENGRIGPISDLQRLACATSGGYMYLTNNSTEQRTQAANGLVQLRWLPYAIDGLWEATVGSERLRRNNVPAGTFIRVGTQMQLSVAGQSQTYSFSQGGTVSADRSVDTRSVVKTK